MLNLPTINRILIFIIGVVNVLPIAAFFDVRRTEQLYGVRIENESLEVLMRHRGVLLALLGAGLIYSVFKPEFRLPMIAAALVSKFVFIFLTYGIANASAEVGRVALIDTVSIVVLLFVLGIEVRTNK